MTAGVPDDADRGPVRGDAAGVRVGLPQPEQRVLRALDEQRRGGDPVEHRARTAALEHRGDLGGERPGGGGGLVGGADVGPEPAAGQRLGRGRRVGGRRSRCVVDGPVPRRRARAVPTAGARRPTEQIGSGGHGPDAEEQARPGALEDPGVGAGRAGGQGAGAVDDPGGLGEQRRGEGVPGDLRRDRVDPLVVGGSQQRQRPAVGGAGDADPRVARRVQEHVVPPGQPVQQRRDVGHLEAGVVQPDLPGAGPEPAGGPGEDDVAALGEVLGVRGHRRLAAAEPVGQEHRRGRVSGGRRGRHVEGGVELDGVSTGAGGHPLVLGGDALRGARRPTRGQGEQRHGQQGDEQGGERRPGALVGTRARADGRRPGDEAHVGGNGRRVRWVPAGTGGTRPGAAGPPSGQGCQFPVATTTSPGSGTPGTSKKRGAGPEMSGNWAINSAAAASCPGSPSV